MQRVQTNLRGNINIQDYPSKLETNRNNRTETIQTVQAQFIVKTIQTIQLTSPNDQNDQEPRPNNIPTMRRGGMRKAFKSAAPQRGVLMHVKTLHESLQVYSIACIHACTPSHADFMQNIVDRFAETAPSGGPQPLQP